MTAFLDGRTGLFLTRPKPHITNAVRRLWTHEIHIFESVIKADVFALLENVTAIALNGCELRQLSARLVGMNPRIVHADRLEVAA